VDPELLDQARRQQSEHWQGLVSALNASKKLHRFRMMAQEGLAVEEEEESKLSVSLLY
jgi:hypothetical protein